MLWIVSVIFFSLSAYAQEIFETEATGVGLNKTDATQDALRNAIGQAVGVALKSETRVENFVVVSDAISSNINGYITSYTVVSEIPFPDRFEVKVKAKVTTAAMKADFNLLSKSIGGVRFLVMADGKHAKDKNAADYDYAVQKINNFLAERKYRYIEKGRFESLRKEAMNMMEESDTAISYAQRLAVMSDAQFLVVVSDIKTETIMGAFDIPRGTKVSLVAKTYDNCTGEGLGTVTLESSAKPNSELASGLRPAIDDAVNNGFEKLLLTFTEYIGGWVNNGTPFELRFYNTGTFRDFRDLRTALKNDSQFGGDMEVVSAYNYTKLNCTFKSKADDLADKLLDIADGVPNMAAKRLDVKLIYGRQISFAPQNYIIPNLVKPEGATEEPIKQPTPATNTKTGNSTTKPATTGTPAKTTSGTKTGTNAKPAPTKTTTPSKINTNPKTK
jgi:hypothetical protein